MYNIKLTDCIDLKFPFDSHAHKTELHDKLHKNKSRTLTNELQTDTTVKYQQLSIGSYNAIIIIKRRIQSAIQCSDIHMRNITLNKY